MLPFHIFPVLEAHNFNNVMNKLIFFSETIPEALNTDCAKCNEKVKTNVKKVLHHLIEKKPDMWKALEDKYDPTGKYKKKYKEELAQDGIIV